MENMQDNFRSHSENEENNRDITKNQEGTEYQNENGTNNSKSQTQSETINEKDKTVFDRQKENIGEKDEAVTSFDQTHDETREKIQTQNQENDETIQKDQIFEETQKTVLSSSQSAEESPQKREDIKQYSCSYQPPDYIPNFTVSAPTTSKKAKGSKRVGVVITLILLAVFISLVGSVWGYALGRKGSILSDLKGILNGNVGTDSMTVIKNDGSIKVSEVVGSTGYSNLSISEVVALVADSVVEITTTQRQTDPFYGDYVIGGAGSGVIIDREGTGFIITNHHVIDDADQITVRLTNGSEYEATCLGSDADYDIAVLKINASGLTFATMGSSSSLKVGQEVVAIGNPLGSLGGTVTNGIISALDRNVIVDGHRMTLLQTNAAINPGNSGGGLFDMGGNLIGIVNAKQSDTGIEGLGFAIPIDIAWAASEDIIRYGYVTDKLDLNFKVTEYTESFSLQAGMSTYSMPAGVYITESSFDALSAYDRIKSLNGTSIETMTDYYAVIDQLKDGDTLNMVIQRLQSNRWSATLQEKEVTVTVTFTKKPT